jgi:hypothetical protein
MVNRTLERISAGELAKAVSSSTKGVELASEMLKRSEEKVLEARMFGQCCPETVYISPGVNSILVGVVIAGFFSVVIWLVVTCWRMGSRRQLGVPAALMM